MAVLALLFLTGCSGTTEIDGARSANSCALRARLDGRWYLANGGIRVIPTYGEPLGTAVVPPCEGGDGFRIEAVTIVGVSPEVAFASPSREETIFIAEGTASLPPELKRFRRQPRCANPDVSILLDGPWLGIIGPDGRTEIDLVPPYRVSMRVDEASDPRYERVFLTIYVGSNLGHPLSREDIRSSLWEGGSLAVTATCVDKQFWAEHVTASPPL
jgi:hypothetical protein